MLLAGCAALATGLLPVPAFQELRASTGPCPCSRCVVASVPRHRAGGARRRPLPQVTSAETATARPSAAPAVLLLWLLIVIALATVSTVFFSPAGLRRRFARHPRRSLRAPPSTPALRRCPFALTAVWLANTASLLLPVIQPDQPAGAGPGSSSVRLRSPRWSGRWPSSDARCRCCFSARLPQGVPFRGSYGPQPVHKVREPGAPLCGLRRDGGAAAGPGVRRSGAVPGRWSRAAGPAPAVFLCASPRRSALVHGCRGRPLHARLRYCSWWWRPCTPTGLTCVPVRDARRHRRRLPGPPAARRAGRRAAANAAEQPPRLLAGPGTGRPDSPGPARRPCSIGVNLGPLVTPWASLATLLWHERLRFS